MTATKNEVYDMKSVVGGGCWAVELTLFFEGG